MVSVAATLTPLLYHPPCHANSARLTKMVSDAALPPPSATVPAPLPTPNLLFPCLSPNLPLLYLSPISLSSPCQQEPIYGGDAAMRYKDWLPGECHAKECLSVRRGG